MIKINFLIRICFEKNCVLDVEYTEPDNVRGNYEWPVTLPPKLLKDGFQIQPTKVSLVHDRKMTG